MEKEMAGMEELHDKELKFLQTNMGLIQNRYVVQSGRAAIKIKQLKDTIQEMHVKTEMSTERIKRLLTQRKESALKMIADKIEQGWGAWSTQGVELHILRADQENR